MTPKMTKISESYKFQKFYAFFPIFLTDFVVWYVEKVQQIRNVLSSRLFKPINAVFQTKTVRNLTSEKPKFLKVSDFYYF